jgi:hypothetical protein
VRFAVESWDPGYGSAIESLDLDQAKEAVDAAIEVNPAGWSPIAPDTNTPIPAVVHFVDGVRRIDARVWIEHDGVSRPGVCATVGAGVVRAEPGRATVIEPTLMRGLYASPDGAEPIHTKVGSYELIACDGASSESVYLAIHSQMTELERQVSIAVANADLAIVDGPLRGRSAPHTVGYVKTQHVQYLTDDLQRVVGALAPGERTPLFLIQGRQGRYSWYLRLPGPRAHPLSGVVRCEVPALGEVGAASARASTITATLPRFASEPHKDGRAPQNLYPIAGLENELRRRLGDARLMERALRAASISSV